MPLTPGTFVGPYEVVALLGSGGMGEVYRAHDSKLNRDVALKVLLTEVATDPNRLARFRREAQLLAALNHPNIAHIHGLEDSGDVTALVLELVEGPTLADRIADGPLAIDDALTVARQVADALESAHEQGIIHRDLKPANIKLRPDGTVKVLDFGLAKAIEQTSQAGQTGGAGGSPGSGRPRELSLSPTITSPALMTGVGALLGTAAYMSPEQARGRVADKRCDIWAFGCVLYEMLTARRAFDGDEVTDTIVSVVSKDPDWAPIPTRVRRLLQACLEKDPKRRVRDIGDVWRLLDDSSTTSDTRVVTRASVVVPWAAVVTLVVALAGLSWIHYREPAPEIQTLRFKLLPAVGSTFSYPFGVSPDGKLVAFASAGSDNSVRLWVRPLDALQARPLPGTEGPRPEGLIWSPDSRFLAFVSGSALKKVNISGGAPQTICTVPFGSTFRGGAWNSDGVIVYGIQNVGLMQVADTGGTPAPLTVETLGSDGSPVFLPDGRHFLYSKASTKAERGIYIGALDTPAAQQSATPLISNQSAGVAFSAAAGSSGGHILFNREGSLIAQPYDAARRELTGESVTIAADLEPGSATVRPFSASSNGVLLYRSGESAVDPSLVWVDRSGTRLGEVGAPAAYGNVVLSRDGRTLAVARTDLSSVSHSWVVDIARGVFSRLNPGEASDTPEAISPDERVAFTLQKGAAGDIYAKRVSGVDAPELLVESNTIKHPNDWSRDGRFLIYDDHSPLQRQDLWILPLQGDRKPVPFLVTPADETFGQFSPDGRWIAYSSDESGRREVYVRGFAQDRTSASVGQWTISAAGGDKPRWSADGKELFYIALDGKMTAVAVKSGTSFEPGVATALFDTRVAGFAPYDVAPDGRFLINTYPESAAQSTLNVIVNWRPDTK